MSNMPLLEIKNIYKSFSGVYALKDVSFACDRGEIVGLIGENGAGKSTLMKILAGSYQRDSGSISIDGKDVQISSPIEAQKLGIGMVYQDTRLAPDLTVWQNIFLGREIIGKFGILDKKKMREQCVAIMQQLECNINPDAYVKNLNMAEKQLVEIAKACSRELNILILDEPTSMITPAEADKLFKVLREIRDRGVCILFISHRLGEVLTICNRFIVLKDGTLSGELQRECADEDALISLMVGRSGMSYFKQRPSLTKAEDKPIVEVKNLSSKQKFENISFNIMPGEIVGLFGIQGNGQREIVRTLAGLNPVYEGSISIDGKPVDVSSPTEAKKNRIAYISDERKIESIFLPMSLTDNITIPNISAVSTGGILSGTRTEKYTDRALESFDVKYDSKKQKIEQLSGGNQQKIVLAAQYFKEPRLCVFNEPTVGIDVKSKSEIYEFLQKLIEKNIGVIVVSSDMVELINISHRIIVVSNGQITEEIKRENANEERIMSAAVRGIRRNNNQNTSTEKRKEKNNSFLSENAGIITVAILLALLFVLGINSSSAFFTSYNLSNIGLQVVPLMLAALGQTLVLYTGGIDLSVGYTMSLMSVLASYVIIPDGPIMSGVVICLLSGLFIGFFNGVICSKLHVPDLVATFAGGMIVNGIALILRPSAGGKISSQFCKTLTLKLLDVIPVSLIGGLIIAGVIIIYLKQFRGGTYFYAVGSSWDTSFISGIKVDWVKIRAYAICGLMAGLAGLVLSARIASGDPRIGNDFTMSSVTAAVVGGIAITGGRGKPIGAMLGALMIQLTQNVLNMMQISSYYQYIWVGGLLMIAVILYQGSTLAEMFKVQYIQISRKLNRGKGKS